MLMTSSWCAQEENEGEEDLLDQLASVLTAVLRKYGDAALPFLAELMPALGALLEPGRDPEERRIAICILDDILEHCPAGARALAHVRSVLRPGHVSSLRAWALSAQPLVARHGLGSSWTAFW